MERLLDKVGIPLEDFDLIEINEAFAAQVLADGNALGFDWDKVNVNGGAVALGHPIGASGARVLTTLLYALRNRGGKRGLATCASAAGERWPWPSSSSDLRRSPEMKRGGVDATSPRDRVLGQRVLTKMSEPPSGPGVRPKYSRFAKRLNDARVSAAPVLMLGPRFTGVDQGSLVRSLVAT